MDVNSFPTTTRACDWVEGLEPLDAGNTPASPGQINPGKQYADPPGPVQRWPYGTSDEPDRDSDDM